MRWILIVLAVAVALVALDRAVAHGWFDRRHPRPHRPSESSAASGMFGDLVEIFQPNRVHLTAEQERQRLDIQHAGDTAPPVDLDAGTARLDPPSHQR